ncbi:SPOR domain-containing protein [Altererythrobacter sp. ZODW24]|uniref:SPOR domain-containing protein n=1 Tax=Altererythrobacter sp. ZODW24 TaxID=2185142 RepID=UPI001F07CA50|nr:SPOR domain-containing protein [Altererythrobacter sp. ZODW24]
MKLNGKNSARAIAALTLGLSAASCGITGDAPKTASAQPLDQFGPAADYPVVIGEPFTVDGKLYTPEDTMNYDEVGYADRTASSGAGVTASHRTLPLPSYVEVTSLDSGKTILVRVENRGPMAGTRLLGLSQDAGQQLGIADGAPIRVRRVNPPEADRTKLRMAERAPERMETPASLLTVLKRKLPARGSAPLMASRTAPSVVAAPIPVQTTSKLPKQAVSGAFNKYELPPIGGQVAATPRPAPRATATPTPRPAPVRAAPAPRSASKGDFVVQAAAFSSRANADRAAKKLGGFIVQAGRYYRVRTGPFDSRGEAQAALAKVRAAGYSDARVSTAG